MSASVECHAAWSYSVTNRPRAVIAASSVAETAPLCARAAAQKLKIPIAAIHVAATFFLCTAPPLTQSPAAIRASLCVHSPGVRSVGNLNVPPARVVLPDPCRRSGRNGPCAKCGPLASRLTIRNPARPPPYRGLRPWRINEEFASCDSVGVRWSLKRNSDSGASRLGTPILARTAGALRAQPFG
jgi:hypothetical protein